VLERLERVAVPALALLGRVPGPVGSPDLGGSGTEGDDDGDDDDDDDVADGDGDDEMEVDTGVQE
jgi:hypothetical protein